MRACRQRAFTLKGLQSCIDGFQVAMMISEVFDGHGFPPTAWTPRDFEVLLDHIPAGVVIHGADSRAVYANRCAHQLLGGAIDLMRKYPADSGTVPLLRADGTVLPPDANPVSCVLSTGLTVRDAIVGLPGPNPRWLICNAYPLLGADGHLQEVAVCFTECTDLKRIEESLLKSEERLRLAMEGSTDAPWDWDVDSGLVHYSERWWNMLGFPPSHADRDPVAWRTQMHPDDMPRVDAFVDALVASDDKTYSLEFRLRHHDGHYVPVLSRGLVQRDARGKGVRIAGTNTDLTAAKEAERRIHELAYFDYLTGLPNRRLLIDELSRILPRCARSGQFGALLFIDLDNFKLLNDTLGHDAGDTLLREVAARLRATVRASDHLARLGGDEFVVVLEGLGTSEGEAIIEARMVGAKLLEALARPRALGARPSVSTPSIGVVTFGAGAHSVDQLLRHADLAMYRAKAEGRNTLRFFDPGMQAAAERQVELENDLRDAIAGHRFELYCQPQLGINGKLAGAEALLRWRHTTRGLVTPDEFIGLAESSGLIMQLGAMVLSESCRALARWAGYPQLREVSLSVNISVQQLRDPGFVEQVLAILAATGAPPQQLFLELTESVFAHNLDDACAKMNDLRAHGVCFSLDDFGTGYSSLAYLKHFPLTELKIDRSFVKDLPGEAHAGAIVDAILALARTLELDVVAEGIETGEQRDFLIARGCRLLQGFLLGMPRPIAEFEAVYGATGNQLNVP
jgi:diguanylate cyclase (GGDEF)-like protein/PAS domain S-box-containing protein